MSRKFYLSLFLATVLGGSTVVAGQLSDRLTPFRKVMRPQAKVVDVRTLMHPSYALNAPAPAAPLKAEAENAPVLEEDFSLMTMGSEDAPDQTADFFANDGFTILPQYTHQPGWVAMGVAPAGGALCLLGNGGFNFVQTPTLDLTPNSGTAKMYFRAKAIDEGAIMMVGNCDVNASRFKINTRFYPSTQWRLYSAPLVSGGPTDVAQVQALGGVLIDDVRIVSEGVPAPKVLPCSKYDYSSFTANWEPLEGADSYTLHVYVLNTVDYEYMTYKDFTGILGTSYEVTGLDKDRTYAYRVSAVRGGDESVESEWAEVQTNLSEPVALQATDYTGDAFTAHWQPMEGAKAFRVNVCKQVPDAEFGYRYQVSQAPVVDGTATSARITQLNPDTTYTYYIQAQDEYGVWTTSSEYIRVSVMSLGAPVANAATNVTDESFTASWSPVPFATHYLATLYKGTVSEEDGDPIEIVDADFSYVFSTGTMAQPEEKFQDLDLSSYASEAYGWTATSYPSLIKGAVGINNTMGMWFGNSYIVSPQLDLSKGNVVVNVACASNDATTATIALATVENGQYVIKVSEDVQLTSTMDDHNVVLTGGPEKGHILIFTPQAGHLFVKSILASEALAKGQELLVPAQAQLVEGHDATQATFNDLYFTDTEFYAYDVKAQRIDNDNVLSGEASNLVSVGTASGVADLNAAATQAYARMADGRLMVTNPASQAVAVYNAAGALVLSAAGQPSATYSLPTPGMYIVKVGAESFKVLNK